MDIHSIQTIAGQEITIHVRSRWILLFAGVFAALALAISYFGMVTAGQTGFQGFTRTSASLLNLVLYLIPLIALMMGTLSFTGDKSCGEILFAQPVGRTEILLGKLTGDFVSIATATFLGFGVAGMIIAANAGVDGATRYPLLVLFSLILAIIFLGISAFISTVFDKKGRAFAIALFVWFFFVLFYDLLVIGITFVLPEHSANRFLFLSLFANPVDLVRVATSILLDGEQIFGAAGASLLKFLGGKTYALCALIIALYFWIHVPVLFAKRILNRQDI
jgi:Cu-processing system permease protein